MPIVEKLGSSLSWFLEKVLHPLSKWTMEKALPAAFDVLAQVMRALNPILEVAGELLGWLWDKFLAPVASWAGDTLIKGMGGLSDVLGKVASWLEKIKGPLLDGLSKAWAQYGEPVWKGIQEAAQKTGDALQKVWDNIIRPVFDTVMVVLGKLWSNHLEPLVESFGRLVSKLAEFALAIYNNFVAPFIGWFAESIGPVIAEVLGKMFEDFGRLLGWVTDVATGILDWFGQVLDFFLVPFKTDWGKVWVDIKESFGGAWNDMMLDFKRVYDNIMGWIGNLINKITEFLGLKTDLMDMPGVKISIENKDYGNASTDLAGFHIPKLANGAILKDNTLFLGGEYAGASTNPEIVSPQSLMYQTVVDANGPLVAAFEAIVGRVVDAIENQDYSTYLDGEKLYRSTAEYGRRQQRMTGIV